jgi:Domain of unknown function (DUF4388)
MPKRQICVSEIVNDIRSGMGYSELMSKYRLTLKGLDSAFQKLLSAGLISEEELNSGNLGHEQTVNLSGLFALQGQENGHVPEKRKKEYSFSGLVESIDLLDYLQWMLVDGRSTVLEIRCPNWSSCTMYLNEGQIIHAVNGEQEGEEALFSILMHTSGQFVHLGWSEPDQQTIQRPGIQLLLEAARRRDEADS